MACVSGNCNVRYKERGTDNPFVIVVDVGGLSPMIQTVMDQFWTLNTNPILVECFLPRAFMSDDPPLDASRGRMIHHWMLQAAWTQPATCIWSSEKETCSARHFRRRCHRILSSHRFM